METCIRSASDQGYDVRHTVRFLLGKPGRVSRAFLGLLGLCLVVLTGLSPAQEARWETLSAQQNLLLQRRPYEGSPLHEIRGVTSIQSSLSAAVALLRDARFNQYWVYRSGGAEILQTKGYKTAYVYGVVDAPWPIQDRDTVVRFDYSQHPVSKTIIISIHNVPDFIAPKKTYVRVPDMGGYWKLKPEPGGWIEVTFQVYGNPGGQLPVWLANQAAALSVRKTLLNMQDAVARYAGVRLSYVVERDHLGG